MPIGPDRHPMLKRAAAGRDVRATAAKGLAGPVAGLTPLFRVGAVFQDIAGLALQLPADGLQGLQADGLGLACL